MSLGLAKYYSDAISDNVRRAQETKLRKGEWLSKAPFGYKNIRLANGSPDIVVDGTIHLLSERCLSFMQRVHILPSCYAKR